MLVILLCLIYTGMADICGEIPPDDANLIWETMKACAVATGCAICLLVLSWLIYGAVLIILTL